MKTIKDTVFLLGYVKKYTHAFLFWTVVEGIVWGCIHSFSSVLFVKALFDLIGEQAPFSEILRSCGFMAAFFILVYIFHEWYWKIIEPQARQELHKKMQEKLFTKAKTIDLSCYDNPEFYTDFVWAINEADTRAVAAAEDMGKVINRLISSTVIVSLLFTVDYLIVIAICLTISATVFLKLMITKLKFKRDLELIPVQRKSDYIGRIFYLADYSKEIRLSHVGEVLNREFDSSVDRSIKILKNYGKKIFLLSALRQTTCMVLFEAGIMLLLIYKIVVQKSITLGDFAASVGAVWKLLWQINNLMDYIAKFKEHSIYADKFRVFINYSSTVKDSEKAVSYSQSFEEIKINNITFRYSENDEPIIKNLSMIIKAHQKIALVGYNGAGKTTLTKLLMRLYDPTSGNIQINGKNIKNYTSASYRKIFRTVFQDFQIYAASIGENVKTDIYTTSENEDVKNALKRSGFENVLNELPSGIQTQLTKEFDPNGVNFSGGEMQKIAISRIFAQPCDIVILDEPSSALDPISEYELNQVIMSEAFDKTVIFISHRLSTTRMADIIYMLEDGKISEQGSHEELMKLNGKYAAMFNMQAEKYRTGEKEK